MHEDCCTHNISILLYSSKSAIQSFGFYQRISCKIQVQIIDILTLFRTVNKERLVGLDDMRSRDLLRWRCRLANHEDIPALKDLIYRSISTILPEYLTSEQVNASYDIMGIDHQLIDDGTYYVAILEEQEEGDVIEEGMEGRRDGREEVNTHKERENEMLTERSHNNEIIRNKIIGCGGWSYRKTLYGGSHTLNERDDMLLDPSCDAAKIRAMYTDPNYIRRGIGRLIIQICEEKAIEKRFTKYELMATMAGQPLYERCGYHVVEKVDAKVGNVVVPLFKMEKYSLKTSSDESS